MSSQWGCSKKSLLHLLVDKLHNKITGRKGSLLSAVEKDVLLKIVAQSISNYAMFILFLPMSFTSTLMQSMHRFWWSLSYCDCGVAWLNHNLLSESILGCELGFRDLEQFNLALMEKNVLAFTSLSTCSMGSSPKMYLFPPFLPFR